MFLGSRRFLNATSGEFYIFAKLTAFIVTWNVHMFDWRTRGRRRTGNLLVLALSRQIRMVRTAKVCTWWNPGFGGHGEYRVVRWRRNVDTHTKLKKGKHSRRKHERSSDWNAHLTTSFTWRMGNLVRPCIQNRVPILYVGHPSMNSFIASTNMDVSAESDVYNTQTRRGAATDYNDWACQGS
jgi:hypothetical protein